MATLALAILGPIVLATLFHGALFYLSAGVVAWAFAVFLKRLGAKFASQIVEVRIPAICRAVAGGMWSAVTELGLSLVVFLLVSVPLHLLYVCAVGLGAAAAEILFLAVRGAVSHGATPRLPPPDWIEGAKGSYVIQHMFFIERILASAGHVAARVLVYLSVSRNSPWPGLCAFVMFAVIDATAQYGHVRGWNWFSPAVACYYYGMVSAAVLVEALAIYSFIGMR